MTTTAKMTVRTELHLPVPKRVSVLKAVVVRRAGLDGKKLPELKELCKQAGKKVSGNKADLIARLRACD